MTTKEEVVLKSLFRVRTVTVFLTLHPNDVSSDILEERLTRAASLCKTLEQGLTNAAYTVQTVRLAINPFGEWLLSSKNPHQLLARLDAVLCRHAIDFCSLGPATSASQLVEWCPQIVAASPRFSCSGNLDSGTDVETASAAAECIVQISQLDANAEHLKQGLGNFRFCVAANCPPHIPFFPAAKATSCTSNYDDEVPLKFAIGLENGALAHHLLSKTCGGSLQRVPTDFLSGLTQALLPLQVVCQELAKETGSVYIGMDTSLNPSLDPDGSVGHALEALQEVDHVGGPGTLAAAAAVTTCLQTLPEIVRTGYCGLMLPLCEDVRLAELANEGSLRITDLLAISNVCGVGVDTVPLPGDVSIRQLQGLLLDVAAVAFRWNKSLSCRVFPVPGSKAGDWTTYDFVHMINAKVQSLT